MEAKHTPGTFENWEIREIRRVPDYGNEFLEIGNELNSCAYVPRLHPDADKITSLLKAAPDLLAALEDVFKKYGKPVFQGDPYTLSPLMEQAKAAIAKAKGEPC